MNVISEEFLLLEHGHENDGELAYEGESFEIESGYAYLNHILLGPEEASSAYFFEKFSNPPAFDRAPNL